MIIAKNIDEIRAAGAVITIGLFDGFHLGHRELVGRVVSLAKQKGMPSLVITFWPHPRLFSNGSTHKFKLLTSLEEKYRFFKEEGIEGVLTIDFNSNFANISAKDFVDTYLISKLRISHIVVGHNHSFGHGGEGNYLMLEKYAKEKHFSTEKLPPVKVDGMAISSTKIRNAIEVGNLALANRMLGYPYRLTGTIDGGQQLGRSIGFPTANILPINPEKLIPARGVYAVWVVYQNKPYPAMLNIGVKPTLGDGLCETIEAHIIGFDQNIYNESITVLFQEKIREEMKFSGLDELRRQLERDKETTLSILGFTD